VKKTKRQLAFTLVELLVVIAIIGLIATLSVVARAKSRDARRVADTTQMKTALEMYFRDEGKYPDTFVPGELLVGTLSSTTYMRRIPSNIGPRTNGDCPNSYYLYEKVSNTEYNLQFCLGKQSTNIPAGYSVITPWEIQSGRGLIYKPNLVGWWDATIATNTTFIVDKAGNNNNLTLYNGALVTTDCRKIGESCYSFDGVDDYGKIVNSNSILTMGYGEVSVSLWVKENAFPNNNIHSFFSNRAGGGFKGYSVGLRSNTSTSSSSLYLDLYGDVGLAQPKYFNYYFPNTGEWYYVTAVFYRNMMITYKNGVLFSSLSITDPGFVGYVANTDSFIGSHPIPALTYYLNGQLADIRIYNRALTANEAKAIYDATK